MEAIFAKIVVFVVLSILASQQNGNLGVHPKIEEKFYNRSDTTDTLIMEDRWVVQDQEEIYAPVKIGASPGNEAVVVPAFGVLKIFYINRPGEADKVMSLSSVDSGFTWSNEEAEFKLPGQAYYALQVISTSDSALVSVFHLFNKGPKGYKGRHLDLWANKMGPEDPNWSKLLKMPVTDLLLGQMKAAQKLIIKITS